MESPNDRTEVPQVTDLEQWLQACFELKQEMERLLAQARYLRLIVRLGLRLP